MNADGSSLETLLASGRSPDMNDAGEILFHDDAYTVQKRLANAATMSLGEGAFPRWTSDGRIVFQCTAFNGGLCTMNGDGSFRKTLLASGRSPDMNAAGVILFHDDAYTVQKRLADGTTASLGEGASPRWTSDGRIVFQCTGLSGGLCTMNADGSSRKTLLASGRSPDMNDAGVILFHDDAYTVKKLLPDGTTTPLAPGASPSWTP
jgi:hypothetical protein